MLLPFLLSSMTSLSLKLKPYLEESTESVLLGNSVFTGHHSMRSDLGLFEYILYLKQIFKLQFKIFFSLNPISLFMIKNK